MINYDGFVQVKGYENYYVNKKGVVIGNTRSGETILKWKTANGYAYVGLCKNGIVKYFKIHRLVAIAFIQNVDNKPCVNHIDGNKLNNDISNLEWVTYSENTKHFHNKILNIPGTCIKKCALFFKDEFISEFNSIQDACKYASENGASYNSLQKYYKSKGFSISFK